VVVVLLVLLVVLVLVVLVLVVLVLVVLVLVAAVVSTAVVDVMNWKATQLSISASHAAAQSPSVKSSVSEATPAL
jgi:hypothetical protein